MQTIPGQAKAGQTTESLLTSASAQLETSGPDNRLFFTHDVHPVVVEACRCHKISFEDFAPRIGTTRMSLLLMLKGIDPVPLRIRDALRDFVAAAREGRRPNAA